MFEIAAACHHLGLKIPEVKMQQADSSWDFRTKVNAFAANMSGFLRPWASFPHGERMQEKADKIMLENRRAKCRFCVVRTMATDVALIARTI